MNIGPLIKKEFHLIKWVCLFALLCDAALLYRFGNSVVNKLGGNFYTSLDNLNRFSSFFYELPDIKLLIICIIVLSFVQFYGNNRLFLFSLPIKKIRLIQIKLGFGLTFCTLLSFIHGTGVIRIFIINRSWLSYQYADIPMAVYETVVRYNSLRHLLQYLVLLWLTLVAIYMLFVFFQVVVSNKIAALCLSWAALWYPILLRSGVFDLFNSYISRHHLMDGESPWQIYKRLSTVFELFSLPGLTGFQDMDISTVRYVSAIGRVEEWSFWPRIAWIEHYTLKTAVALILIIIFTKLTISLYQASFAGEESGMFTLPSLQNKFLAIGAASISLIFTCWAGKYINSLPFIVICCPVASLLFYAGGWLGLRQWEQGTERKKGRKEPYEV